MHTSPQGHSIMLAQEYCCGDLSHIIGGATQRFPEAVVKGIMQQVLRGLAAIHQAGGGRGAGLGRGGGWREGHLCSSWGQGLCIGGGEGCYLAKASMAIRTTSFTRGGVSNADQQPHSCSCMHVQGVR